MNWAIEAEDLTKRFRYRSRWLRTRTVVALDHVTFSVARGETLGIVGSNGSGKSTLLRILSTVLLPTSGKAWVAGHSISKVTEVKKMIGVIQGDARGFSGFLSGRQNLEFFAVLQQVPQRALPHRVASLLETVGLSHLEEQPAWSYSTGQRQRLNIARALLHDPPILLFDEPMKGVDPWMAQELRDWIRKELLDRRGKTLLLASNQWEDVREICDRVFHLEKGRIVWEGSAETPPVGLRQGTPELLRI